MDATRDTLLFVPPEEVPSIWPKIEPYIQAANNYGGGKISNVDWLVRVLTGMSELFVSPDLRSAAIGEVQVFPRRRVYGIILLGGEGSHNWDMYQAAFESAMRQRQCDCLEVFGRPGWKNILKPLGYEVAHWVWRKEF